MHRGNERVQSWGTSIVMADAFLGLVPCLLAISAILVAGCGPSAQVNAPTDAGATDAGTFDAGTRPACDPAKALCPCESGGVCASGMQCVGGTCIVACNHSFQCGPGRVCFDGACVPGCSTSAACPAGMLCEGGGCVPDPGHPACGPSMTCPVDQICADGQCASPCSSTTNCGSGEVCEWAKGACVPDPQVQRTCSATQTCPAQQVCGTDGACRYACADLDQCKLYDNRFVACASGVCETQEEASPECTLSMPCPTGQHCVSNACH